MAKVSRVGLLGGGVIGGGWAARFLINGIDVQLFDPDPEAERKLSEIMVNARQAWRELVDVDLPTEGTAIIVKTVAEAVAGVNFIQESAPERLELKQALLAEADAAAAPDVVIGSSTSGLLPTQIAANMTNPERFVVGHPFNPVYLLPLVEVCGGDKTALWAADRATEIYESIGMRPLRVRKEIDGFVADRLMEALWREALWLVNDGIATVEEVDDAIRFGAGLRWSFMGSYQTYRIAGGEGGMRHFMAQFGPSLAWPWTHLMDVPELTDDLLDRISDQSDEQVGDIGTRDLERWRDRSLIAVMRALRDVPTGAGEVLAQHEERLRNA